MGGYIADFAAHSCKIVVEVDGESHDFDESIRKDEARDQWFASRGYRVLRFTNDDVLKNLEGWLLPSFRQRSPGHPSLPDPPPQGGRERRQRCIRWP